MGKICIDTGTKFNIKEGKTYKVRCLYSAPSSENEFEAILQIYDDETKKHEYIVNKFKVCTERFIKFQDYVMLRREYIDFTNALYHVSGEYTCGECKFNIVDGYPQIDLKDIDFFKFAPYKKILYDTRDNKKVLSPDYLNKNKHYEFFISDATMCNNNLILEYFIYMDKEKKEICFIKESFDMQSVRFKKIVSILIRSSINVRLMSINDIEYHGEACFYNSNGNWHININSMNTLKNNIDRLSAALTVEFVENVQI